jgi:hypothetical protein
VGLFEMMMRDIAGIKERAKKQNRPWPLIQNPNSVL